MADKPFDPTLKTLVEVGPEDWTVFAGQGAATPKSPPNSDRANAPGTASQTGPPTLGSCARAAVLSGGALLGATAVTYQATPAWVIAYGAPAESAGGSPGTLDRVVVEVRSQSTCSVLDQATLVP